jgi:hypothetical protein
MGEADPSHIKAMGFDSFDLARYVKCFIRNLAASTRSVTGRSRRHPPAASASV